MKRIVQVITEESVEKSRCKIRGTPRAD